MGKQVQVKFGFSSVLLHPGGIYHQGEIATLTDAEFASMEEATLRAVTLLGDVADPTRVSSPSGGGGGGTVITTTPPTFENTIVDMVDNTTGLNLPPGSWVDWVGEGAWGVMFDFTVTHRVPFAMPYPRLVGPTLNRDYWNSVENYLFAKSSEGFALGPQLSNTWFPGVNAPDPRWAEGAELLPAGPELTDDRPDVTVYLEPGEYELLTLHWYPPDVTPGVQADLAPLLYSVAEAENYRGSPLIEWPDGKIRLIRPVGSAYQFGTALAVGIGSFAQGKSVEALGKHSHAEGSYTKTFGHSSHTEGNGTYAFGVDSHAEGLYTRATGDYSHAEGFETHAVGQGSHAEGLDTTAVGAQSRVSGRGAVATRDSESAHGVPGAQSSWVSYSRENPGYLTLSLNRGMLSRVDATVSAFTADLAVVATWQTSCLVAVTADGVATRIVGTPVITKDHSDAGASDWTVQINVGDEEVQWQCLGTGITRVGVNVRIDQTGMQTLE